MLLKMPGINSKNAHLVMNKVNCVADLAQLTEAQLSDILGNAANARQLFAFLHKRYTADTISAAQAKTSAPSGWARGGKRRR